MTDRIGFLLLVLFQRVKVYRLNGDGKWDDQGTGHVTVDYLEVRLHFKLFDVWLTLMGRYWSKKICLKTTFKV